MSFICMRMKNHFHIKGWALNLVLIKRPGETREWLIIKVVTELKTVSLCRIARENLVNYGDAIIYYNIMIKVLVFRNYLVFDEPHFLKKLGGNLRDLLLINVWWVDIYCTLTICLTCTRCNRERQRKVNIKRDDRLSWAVGFSFTHRNTWFRTKTQSTFRMIKGRFIILGTVTLKHSK